MSTIPSSLRRAAPVIAAAMLALSIGVSTAVAQQALPFRKSELVRLLTGSTYAQEEIAAMVTRSCLAFQPTPRDRADLRQLGASRALLAAVDRCAAPPGSSTAVAAHRVFVAEEVEVTAGDTARILAVTTREGRLEPGVPLVLVEPLADDSRPLAEAITGAGGEATFVVPGGAVSRVRPLLVRRRDNEDAGRPFLLVVSPASPVRAVVVPGVIRIPAHADTVLSVLILPRDAFGNAVPELEIVLERRREGHLPDTVERTSSGASGLARVSLVTRGLKNGDVVHVMVASSSLGTAPVAAVSDTRPSSSELLTVRALRILEDAEERMARGELAAALRLYDQVLSTTPGHADATLGRGQALAALGHHAEGEQALLDLLESEPANASALTHLGLLHLSADRLAEAEELFLMALNASPGQSRAARGYATVALRRGNVPLAIRLFEDALELFPDDAEILSALGEAFLEDARPADAASAFQRALALEPLLESARRGLARAER